MTDVHKWTSRSVNGKRCSGNALVFVSAGMRCVGNNAIVTEIKMLPSIVDKLWTWRFRFMNVDACCDATLTTVKPNINSKKSIYLLKLFNTI